MSEIEYLLEQMERNPADIRFSDLSRVCEHYFGKPRQEGTGHRVYKTPWQGNPRLNIQSRRGKAKTYQVRQVLKAVERLRLEYAVEK